MKLLEWLVRAVLVVAGIVALIFFGWCLKGYQIRRKNG